MVKVSPDEDSPEQMSGICDAVWESGVDGVIVGNTTNRRPAPLPAGYILPPNESATLLETGGYSGPQMFDRTLGLVAKYRKMLDQGPRLEEKQEAASKALPPSESPETSIVEKIEAAGSSAAETSSAPAPVQLQLPDVSETVPTSPDDLTATAPVVTTQAPSPVEAAAADRTPFSQAPKEIWATGGVTNGKQALQLLNAGASVAMVYTTMVYNGSGTVTAIKNEMREEVKKL